MSRQSARTLAIVLLVLGVILVGIGLVYFAIPANKLPAILGELQHATAHRTKRGIAAAVLGVASLAGAWWANTQVHRRGHASSY